MDLQVIATAIATTLGTVTATDGSNSESATATADLPNTVGKIALLVYPPDNGDLGMFMGSRLHDHWFFPVKLLRDPVDVPARTRWLYAWATALRPRILNTHFRLGLTNVDEAKFISARLELDGEQYSSAAGGLIDFDVVELVCDVEVTEASTGVP